MICILMYLNKNKVCFTLLQDFGTSVLSKYYFRQLVNKIYCNTEANVNTEYSKSRAKTSIEADKHEYG